MCMMVLFNAIVHDSIDYNIDVSNIVYIQKFLMKKTRKNLFLSFSELLVTKYISLNHEPCLAGPKLI